MWWSNWPMDVPSPSYLDRLDALRTHFPFLTTEERASVLGGTALRLWGAASAK
jgi:predicted TIM-barrel fold metal-dependent hydrolase